MARRKMQARRLAKSSAVRSMAQCLALCAVEAIFRRGRAASKDADMSKTCH
jgi:hypothetical protein